MSEHTDGEIHMGDVGENMMDKMRRNQAENAQLHLIHDFGAAGAKKLLDQYGDALIQAVLQQRAEMQVAGTLYSVNEEGKERLNALDYVALIRSVEKIAQASGQAGYRGLKPAGSYAELAAATKGSGFNPTPGGGN
jgi:hypothetical protein